MFSSMCAICVVPGMGTIQGFCAISQASAICAGRGLLPLGPALHQLDERQVVRQVLRREAGLDAADVAFGEPRLRVDGAGQEADAERAPRHEADAELLAERNAPRSSGPRHSIEYSF